MNAIQFRHQYLYSLSLTFLAVLVFIFAIGMFLYSSANVLINQLSNSTDNPELMIQTLLLLIKFFLVNSVYAMLAIVMYGVGVVWNIVVAIIRSQSQNDYSLAVIVIVGWASSILLPLIGLVISCVAQIWAWFKGSEELLLT